MGQQTYFTDHAKKRFRERFMHHIDKGVPATKILAQKFYKSVPTNTHVNNTQFMANFYEKYGYDHPCVVRTYEDILFVMKEDRLVTVYNVKTSRWNINRSTYRKAKSA